MITIGIDAGFSGAICILKNKECVLFDMPVLGIKTKKQLDLVKIKSMLSIDEPVHVFIERAQVMPGQGISSSGRYMMSYGMLQGLCAGIGLPYTLVTPQAWKKVMMPGMPKGKGQSIIRFLQLNPDLNLYRKKDHNKADAYLIAYYGRILLSKA